MATISCKCGQTQIPLASDTPRGKIQCVCIDCWQHINHMEKKGHDGKSRGPKAPTIPNAYYFDNKFDCKRVVKGKQNLKKAILRLPTDKKTGEEVEISEETPFEGTTRVIAACCNSTMYATSTGYHGNVVAVYPDVCNLKDNVELDLQFRMAMIDFDEEVRGGPPPPISRDVQVCLRGAAGKMFPRSLMSFVSIMKPIIDTKIDESGYDEGDYGADDMLEDVPLLILDEPSLQPEYPGLFQQVIDDLSYKYDGPFDDDDNPDAALTSKSLCF